MKLDHGEVVTVKFKDTVRILRADPLIWISSEFLWKAQDEPNAYMWTNDDPPTLTISDDFGHSFIYRIGAYVSKFDVYEGRWPD